MRTLNSPCVDPITKEDCPDRCAEPNCHMTCEKYIAFDKECQAIRQERIRISDENYDQKCIKERRIKMFTEGKFYRSKRNKG